MSNVKPVPGTNGDQYVPYDQRTVCGIFYQRSVSEDKMKDAVIDAAAAVDGVVPFGQVRKIHYTK